ncbi:MULTISPECIES: NAD(P)-dependent oxidoreductase [unclassified Bacillus (in: firmicutes)]|uniref:NAD-dependent epimerase/dehydratase family protein n=1 Tax=unclassified Bacillus (in: firmicutes) TaxID=185979 RepID=UPI0011213CF7|nr:MULTISPECIES: NAD-dependent epimerase/dehydratase family protein [unclassified Bacillus (in: firmicutes)]
MKVFMIGGTGLLGAEGARVLIEQGHEVATLSLPPIPEGSNLPEEMEITLGNYLTLTDDDIRKYLTGCDGFVFAAGVDERVEAPSPIYSFFEKYNITPLERLLRIAKECGVKHSVVLGSYFAYFNRELPEYELTKHHPYIRSRVDQANMALSFGDDDMSVAVLEVPYVFGSQQGRKPVWVFLVEQIQNMKEAVMYPEGGTTMVTAKQIGECIAGALINGKTGNYPVGYYNMEWKEMLTIFHKYMGTPDKEIITIPASNYIEAMKAKAEKQKSAGIELGLDTAEFAKIFTKNLFIDKKTIVDHFGVQPDDIEKAIGESVQLSLDILEGKKAVVDMKAE